MSIFVNRTLNMKRIKAIGFDMDHTIVRYKSEAFEGLAFDLVKEKLVESKGYPKGILEMSFDYTQVIQGLVLDKKRGNILKLSRYGQVKTCSHGSKRLDFKEQRAVYQRQMIDLSDPNYYSLDTDFSVSNGTLFVCLVDYKDKNPNDLPSYSVLAEDIREAIDLVHAEGPLKDIVRDRIEDFIVQDPLIPQALEKLKLHGKKMLIVTNSDYSYTKLLLEYAIDPFLKAHKSWQELFEIVITFSRKPVFFTQRQSFLKIDPNTGLMSNYFGQITPGTYQGGNAKKLQEDLNLSGDEILYLGDHIYGDVVSLKKSFNWRTGLVLAPLAQELSAQSKTAMVQKKIDGLMAKKETLEVLLNDLYKEKNGELITPTKDESSALMAKVHEIDTELAGHIKELQIEYNPHWGQLMRSGKEESYMAGQIERYACIYMASIADFLDESPRRYFRPHSRILSHEAEIAR